MTRRGIQRRGTRSSSPTGRGRREDRWHRILRWTKDHWQRLLAYDPFWILLFLGTVTWVLSPSQGRWEAAALDPGTIAPRDFVAPRDALIPDEEATKDRRTRAEEEVLPVYDLDPAAADRVEEEISKLFRRGRELLTTEAPEETGDRSPREVEGESQETTEQDAEGPPDELTLAELTGELQEGVRLTLDPEQTRILREREFSETLENRLEAVVDRILERGVVAGKTVLLENRARGIQLRNLERGTERRQLDLYGYLDYPEDVREAVATELRGWADFAEEARGQLRRFLVTNISPNLHLNQRETLRRQERAAAEVEPVYTGVRQGQVIVRQGDQIDAGTARILAALAPERDLGARILPILGTFLFSGLIVLVLWLGVRRKGIAQTKRETVLGESLLLLLASILGARLCVLLADGLADSLLSAPFRTAANYYYAVPFAALALVAVLLYGRGLALLLALSLSVLAPVLVGGAGAEMVIFCLAGSMAAILTVDHYQFKQRSLLVRAGAVVGLVNAVAILMLFALSRGPGDAAGEGSLWLPLVCALAGGVLVAGVTSFTVPVLESLYSVTTGIKLVELANTNLPVLRRLAFEAPGTFQHSLMVANLAKAGCEAIEADSVLAYTGALYHDIGKVFRPEYFVEN
ncbi:MAG: HDIG domain-containing protein, partial [Thermoanaerobaculia bacterium]|nr:HDIG domain-containing protein [Thermoanaerobaculia bacterium]